MQHAIYIRMRHIEEDINFYKVRYLHYLDNPSELSNSGLAEDRIKELEDRTKKWGVHQRKGIQSVIWLLPVSIMVTWGYYVWFLCTMP